MAYMLCQIAKVTERIIRIFPLLKLFLHAIGNLLEMREENVVQTEATCQLPKFFRSECRIRCGVDLRIKKNWRSTVALRQSLLLLLVFT